MDIPKKTLDEFKGIYRKKEGKELSDADAHKMASQLLGLYKLAFDISLREVKRKARLKKEPGGFPVDGHYNCSVCHRTIDETSGWYDWYGQSCLTCRKAILDGTIPSFVCRHEDSYFSMWQINSTFGIKTPTAKKLTREKKLFPRVIENEQGGVHEYIFLKKENPKLIERYSPERKSYDRHREKEHRKWAREQKLKLKGGLGAKRKKG